MREIHPYSYDNADLINNRAELGHLRRLSRFDLDNGHSNSTSTMAIDWYLHRRSLSQSAGSARTPVNGLDFWKRSSQRDIYKPNGIAIYMISNL